MANTVSKDKLLSYLRDEIQKKVNVTTHAYSDTGYQEGGEVTLTRLVAKIESGELD